MSLVTTASSTSWPSARHNAATSAVLPLPTGPPIPIRSGRSPPGRPGCGSGSGTVGSKLIGWTWSGSWLWSADKETHLFPVVAVVLLGQEVEPRRGGRGQVGGVEVRGGRGRRGDRRDLVTEGGDDGVDPQGVQPEQPDGGTRGPGDGEVGGGKRGIGGRPREDAEDDGVVRPAADAQQDLRRAGCHLAGRAGGGLSLCAGGRALRRGRRAGVQLVVHCGPFGEALPREVGRRRREDRRQGARRPQAVPEERRQVVLRAYQASRRGLLQ